MKSAENYIEILRRYNSSYYTSREPEVSDQEYNAIKNEFRQHYPDHPFLRGVGVTSTQTEASTSVSANHSIAMVSLKSISEEGEFRSWANDVSNDGIFCVSEKIIGQSFSVSYLQGKFYQAITKGDGKTGIDISKDLRQKLPFGLPVSISVVLQGVTSPQGLYFFDLLGSMVFHVEHQKFDYIKNILKLQTPFYKKAALEEVVSIYKSYKKNRPSFLDGIIITVDSKIQQEMLGIDKDPPDYKVNFKLS